MCTWGVFFSLPRFLISYPDVGSSSMNTVMVSVRVSFLGFGCGVAKVFILLGYEAMSLDTWFMMFSDDVFVIFKG